MFMFFFFGLPFNCPLLPTPLGSAELLLLAGELDRLLTVVPRPMFPSNCPLLPPPLGCMELLLPAWELERLPPEDALPKLPWDLEGCLV